MNMLRLSLKFIFIFCVVFNVNTPPGDRTSGSNGIAPALQADRMAESVNGSIKLIHQYTTVSLLHPNKTLSDLDIHKSKDEIVEEYNKFLADLSIMTVNIKSKIIAILLWQSVCTISSACAPQDIHPLQAPELGRRALDKILERVNFIKVIISELGALASADIITEYITFRGMRACHKSDISRYMQEEIATFLDKVHSHMNPILSFYPRIKDGNDIFSITIDIVRKSTELMINDRSLITEDAVRSTVRSAAQEIFPISIELQDSAELFQMMGPALVECDEVHDSEAENSDADPLDLQSDR